MKKRILYDLSIAGLGYSGIPQDTRCTFHALATETAFSVDALLYSNIGDTTTFLTLPKHGAAVWKKSWLQARYLEGLTHGRSYSHYLSRIANRLNIFEAWHLHRVSNVKLSLLDNELFFDVIWRLFLGKSLPPSEKQVLSKLSYYLSNISIEAIVRKNFFWSRQYRVPSGIADVVITPDARPLRVRRPTVKISRYHDIIPLSAPDLIGDARRFMQRHIIALRQCVLNGDFFACNSEATESDLHRIFPQLRGRTFVAHCIVGNGLYPDKPATGMGRIREIIQMRRSAALESIAAATQPTEFSRTPPAGQPLRYVLTVSALDPKKNHIGMLRAFRAANDSLGGDYRLVVVGSPGWNEEEILRAMRPMSDRGELILLQSVPLAELRMLYSCASLFLFPSLYEGFGLPPVEAMRCGVPVAASDIPALREVLGDAAYYCNPYSTASISQAIVKGLTADSAERRRRSQDSMKLVEQRFGAKAIADVWERNIHSILKDGRPCDR